MLFRSATLFGFVLGACSFGLALGYLVLKLVSWDAFQLGWAPLLVGTFFLASVQLVSLGVLGEYVGAVLTQVRGVPHVFERERFGAAPPSDETLD